MHMDCFFIKAAPLTGTQVRDGLVLGDDARAINHARCIHRFLSAVFFLVATILRGNRYRALRAAYHMARYRFPTRNFTRQNKAD